jgi:hypothetical protein
MPILKLTLTSLPVEAGNARPLTLFEVREAEYSVRFNDEEYVKYEMPMTDVEYVFYSKLEAQRFQQWIFDKHLVTEFKVKTIKSARGTECRSEIFQLWKPPSQWPIPIEVRTRPRPTNGHYLIYYANNLKASQQELVKIPCKRRRPLGIHSY